MAATSPNAHRALTTFTCDSNNAQVTKLRNFVPQYETHKIGSPAQGANIFMATAQPPAAPAPKYEVRRGVQPLRAGQGYSFIWRKLHSLSGIVPIGAFLLEHLLSNFEALKGPAAYGAQVRFLNCLPLVRVLEWTFIFIPILYHGIYGVYIWLRGKSNVVYYPWAGNWMYVAQRWTGIVAFAYIVQHVLRQRFMGVSLPENPGAAFCKVQHELSNPMDACGLRRSP